VGGHQLGGDISQIVVGDLASDPRLAFGTTEGAQIMCTACTAASTICDSSRFPSSGVRAPQSSERCKIQYSPDVEIPDEILCQV
jgi:hypothetical protein